MADNKVDETIEETEPTEPEETEGTEEEDNWGRMKKLMSDTIDERLSAWQANQPKKTTSSHSPRKAEQPKRKKGFLTGAFFSELVDEDE